jgi:hypothetical protein
MRKRIELIDGVIVQTELSDEIDALVVCANDYAADNLEDCSAPGKTICWETYLQIALEKFGIDIVNMDRAIWDALEAECIREWN